MEIVDINWKISKLRVIPLLVLLKIGFKNFEFWNLDVFKPLCSLLVKSKKLECQAGFPQILPDFHLRELE